LNGRRLFLRGLAGAAAGVAFAPARVLADLKSERVLSFLHTHTREQLTVPYFADGTYLPEGLSALTTFLRDHRTGDEHAIDTRLYDLLNDLRLLTRARSPFQVISAYRSPRTNAMLRGRGTGCERSRIHAGEAVGEPAACGATPPRMSGVAKGSLHLQGRAIDIRLSDVPSATLRDAALELGRGGVGYYAMSDFVHVDTGRVRRW
jgi:uncharacterized protein YcbK (DUF882 family)